jgi:protein SCO1/2
MMFYKITNKMHKYLLSLLFLILLSCGSNNQTFHGSDITQARLQPNFELLDQDEQIFTQEMLTNKISAIFFGFANCPDICPTTMSALKQVSSQVKDSNFQVIFISVDPERDSFSFLKNFISQFGSNVIGLTGSKIAVKNTADAFKVFFEKVEQGDSYTIDHSAGIYLVDKKGILRIREPYGQDISSIAEDVSNLLRE